MRFIPSINPPSFFFVFFFLFSMSLSDPRISEAGLYCGTTKPPPNPTFISNFIKEMETISQLVSNQHWGTYQVNSTAPIYALAQCYQDLSHTDCLLCYAASRTRLPRCLPFVSARIYLDGCFIRYDNYDFYSESTDPLKDAVNCNSINGAVVDEIEKADFVKSVDHVIDTVKRTALEKGGFGVAQVKGVYALAQCWKTVGIQGCRKCLEKAGEKVRGCAPKREGRGLNSGCYLRYSTDKFYSADGEAEHANGKLLS